MYSIRSLWVRKTRTLLSDGPVAMWTRKPGRGAIEKTEIECRSSSFFATPATALRPNSCSPMIDENSHPDLHTANLLLKLHNIPAIIKDRSYRADRDPRPYRLSYGKWRASREADNGQAFEWTRV